MEMMYPSENLVRIFKGEYPDLNFSECISEGDSILDVGCGDGRHLVFFSNDIGLDTFGIEPTERLAELARSNAVDAGAEPVVKAGTNREIPFESNKFEHLVAWNSCYYLGETHDLDFQTHVREYARVTCPGSKIVLSIPKPTSFIYDGSEEEREGYSIINDDPFGSRDGTVLRRFADADAVIESFRPEFDNFSVASVQTDFFGYNYHWWLFVGENNTD
jgi:SAM-dependent methyltransferase